MNKTLFVFVLVLAVFVVPVMSVPPFQSNVNTGLQIVYPASEAYKVNTNVSLHFHVYNSTNTRLENGSVICMFHLYNSTNSRHLLRKLLIPDDTEYSVEINNSLTRDAGIYNYAVDCAGNTTQKENGFFSGSFEISNDGFVKQDVLDGSMWAVVLWPFLLSLILLASAFVLDEEHNLIKIGLYMVALAFQFISLTFASSLIDRFYFFPSMIENIGFATWIFGIVYFFLLSYFCVFAFIKIFLMIKTKKHEKRDYD